MCNVLPYELYEGTRFPGKLLICAPLGGHIVLLTTELTAFGALFKKEVLCSEYS